MKNKKKSKKYIFNIFESFSTFLTSFQNNSKFKILFSTYSAINASISKSLFIFIIESALTLHFLKISKYKKIKYIYIYTHTRIRGSKMQRKKKGPIGGKRTKNFSPINRWFYTQKNEEFNESISQEKKRLVRAHKKSYTQFFSRLH